MSPVSDPQIHRPNSVDQRLLRLMNGGGRRELEKVDESERCIIGGDMNGHVGSANGIISRIHGGNAYGNGDEDGEKVVDRALSFDMVIGNARNIREIKNCKVIPGDHVTEQHRLVVIDDTIAASQKQKGETTTQRRIKWFKLKENDFQQEFKDRILRELRHDMIDVNTWWNDANSIKLRAGKEILGESSGKIWENKEIWWFNEEVQEKVSTKQHSKKKDKKKGEEVNAALKKMKNGKATGPDDIPVEVWKEEEVDTLHGLIKEIMEREAMPEKWRESTLIPIFKEKGDIQSCENYRGIKLMQTMEKYQERQRVLHMAFIDLEKAYDRVPRQEVWRGL
ncbi:uncharacterized protein LOC119599254 [Penaeus monodon]|uniref:uncharacterized protein LOC119599254 n=1 Tax=Penaeus monodon TaxID=6687 RepID=UPI0018A7228F|nr:uncharacterized protein LOC119599254 [Penaeus monodon]